MKSSEYQGTDDHIGIQDIRKFQFRSNYESVKDRIESCKKIIKSFEEERDIYHLNIWKEKLAKAENTLEAFDFFISIFPDVIKKENNNASR